MSGLESDDTPMQVDLEMQKVEKPHLKEEIPDESNNNACDIKEESERERWCTDCNRRVTLGQQGDEYGHEVSCEHSIAPEGSQ